MPSDSLAMLMVAVGTQKPADPSIWYCSPVAGSFRARGVNCAATGRRHEEKRDGKRCTDVEWIWSPSCSWISGNEKLARAEGAQNSTRLRERQSED